MGLVEPDRAMVVWPDVRRYDLAEGWILLVVDHQFVLEVGPMLQLVLLTVINVGANLYTAYHVKQGVNSLQAAEPRK